MAKVASSVARPRKCYTNRLERGNYTYINYTNINYLLYLDLFAETRNKAYKVDREIEEIANKGDKQLHFLFLKCQNDQSETVKPAFSGHLCYADADTNII